MKNFIQWNYERGSWQYDVFCLLIVAFIFLTPKTWFEKKERLATPTAQRVVKEQDFSPVESAIQKRAAKLNGD